MKHYNLIPPLPDEFPGKVLGTAYLIRFDAPLGDASRPRMHCRYTVCWATDYARSIKKHEAGQHNNRMTREAYIRGISFSVVRVWLHVPRSFVTSIRKRGNYHRLDPLPFPLPY